MSWQSLAACRGLGPDLFFLERSESVLEAKAVCWGCPVRKDCLAHAMADDSLSGIWGATTRKQRRLHRQAQRRAVYG